VTRRATNARQLALACQAATLLCLVLTIACEAERRVADPPPGPDRFARRFLPFDAAWNKESEIPREPQKSPPMVIWEVSEVDPRSEPTREQLAAGEALAARCLATAERKGWFEFSQGLADGYHLLAGDRRHYVRDEYIFDDAELDCDRPEFLMYYGTPKGKMLAGLMFYVSRPDRRGPQVGGPNTLWHYHIWSRAKCLVDGLLLVSEAQKGRCARGEPRYRSPEMMHIWFLDHPEGRFATTMWLDREQLDAALEQRAAEPAH